MDKNMKMNRFIETLKQQSRQGGVPILGQANQAARQTPTVITPAATPAAAAAAGAVTQQVQQLAQQLANQIVAEQQQSQTITRNGRVFTKFDTANDVISNQTEVVTGGVWSDGITNLHYNIQ